MKTDLATACHTFEVAVDTARADKAKMPEMGRAFGELCKLAGLTHLELGKQLDVNHATTQRWLNGSTVPRAKEVIRIRGLLLKTAPTSAHWDMPEMVKFLGDTRYHSAILFYLQLAESGSRLTTDALADLLWLAEKSAVPPTTDMMRTFIGITDKD